MKAIRLFAIFFLLMHPSVLLSANITLVPTILIQEKEDGVALTFALHNKGDAAAYAIIPEIRIGGQRIQLDTIKKMEPDELITRPNLLFTTPNMQLSTAGRYPVFIHVAYEDNNHYRFSISDIYLLNYRSEPVEEKLELKAEIKALDSGNFNLLSTIINSGGRVIAGTFRIVLPDELSCEKTRYNFNLDRNQKKKYSHQITNHKGLKGSSYRVFVVAQYAYQGRHCTSLASVLLNVMKNPVQQKESKPLFFALVTMLATAILVFILEVFKFFE